MDFHKVESKWQKRWEKEKVFESEIDDSKKKFFFTTPYPYISGSLHLGHGRAAVESDVFCRYHRMLGENVLFPLSFHITGTPVLGISSAIANGDKKVIELYKKYISAYEKSDRVNKILESFKEPQKIVDFFIPKMMEEYKQFGLGIDWRRSFTSGDIIHQQMVTWQFNKYMKKGYLEKGSYPVLYSIQDESAMGEDDIKDGDSNPVEKVEFCLFKFKLEDGRNLITATLRPDTLFGITNVYVNPDVEYIEIETKGERWIVGEPIIEKLKFQNFSPKIIGKVMGSDLVGQMVDSYPDKKIPILPASFLKLEYGTGIVHSVPSDSADDLIALNDLKNNKKIIKKYNLNVDLINPIEIFDTPGIGGNPAKYYLDKYKVNSQNDRDKLDKIKKELYKISFSTAKLGKLYKKGFSKDLSGMPVFEAQEIIKKELLKQGKINIFYDTSRESFSRSGGKIIVALLNDQWFINFNAKNWKERANKLLKNIKLNPESKRKQFEQTFAWLDKRPCARKRGLGTEFPFDNKWIIESLSDSTLYMTLYTISHLVKEFDIKRENLTTEFFDYVYLGKGDLKLVAKSTGLKVTILKQLRKNFEYWMPNDHRHTFMLHLSNHLSFMIFAYAGLFPKKYQPKKISFHGLVVSDGVKMSKSKGNVITLLEVKEKFGADVFRFYLSQSTNIEGTFDWTDENANNAKKTINKLTDIIGDIVSKRKKDKVEKYYEHKFNLIKKIAFESLNKMELRDYSHAVVYDMLNLVNKAKMTLNKEKLNGFYYYILEDWIKLLSPMVPHLAEELWSKIGGKGFISLAKWPKFDESKINDKFDKEDELIDKIVNDINNISTIVGAKKNVFVYVLPQEKQTYLDNIESIKIRTGISDIVVYAVNDKDKKDPENKSKKVKPGRPGIHFE